MSSRIAVIAIDAAQPRPVADFWCAVLGWRVEEGNDGVSVATGGAAAAIDFRNCIKHRDSAACFCAVLGAIGAALGAPGAVSAPAEGTGMDALNALGAASVKIGLASLISDLVTGAGKLVCAVKNAGSGFVGGFIGGFKDWASSLWNWH